MVVGLLLMRHKKIYGGIGQSDMEKLLRQISNTKQVKGTSITVPKRAIYSITYQT